MIDPRTVLVSIPCHDGRTMAETMGGISQCGNLYAALTTPSEVSHVSLLRNIQAGTFMETPFEWLVMIDNDIAFRREDFLYLMEPCDVKARYFEDSNAVLLPERGQRARFPVPTRETIAQPPDFAHLNEKTLKAADILVCSEYSFKNDTLEPIKLGLGFVRIHRSVFERLQNLKHDGGPTVEVDRHAVERLQGIAFEPGTTSGYPRQDVEALLRSVEDKAGAPRLWQVSHKGRLYYDYFPSGPILSQFVPTADWKGEDHGFFTLCMLAGIIPRIETRTRLIHMGRKGYPYHGPDTGGGQ